MTLALAIGAARRPRGRRRAAAGRPARPAQPAAVPGPRASPSGRAASASSSRTTSSPRPSAYAALVVILAEGGLTTRWADVRRAIGPGIALSTVGVAVSVGVTGAVARAAPRLQLGLRPAAGGGHQLHRRRRRLRHAAPAAPPAPGRRLARGGERAQRRPGHPARRPRSPSTSRGSRAGRGGSSASWWSPSWSAGRSIGVGIGFAGAALLRRVGPARGRLLPAGHPGPLRARLLGGRPGAHRPASSRSTWPASCSATRRCRTARPASASPRAWPRWPRSACSSCSACWSRPARLPDALGPALVVGGALLLLARPLSVVASLVWFRIPWAQQAFISWAGLRGAVPIVRPPSR